MCRGVCVDTWSGNWSYKTWGNKNYCSGIVDPFDSTDNCARTVSRGKVAMMARKFHNAAQSLRQAGLNSGNRGRDLGGEQIVAGIFATDADGVHQQQGRTQYHVRNDIK